MKNKESIAAPVGEAEKLVFHAIVKIALAVVFYFGIEAVCEKLGFEVDGSFPLMLVLVLFFGFNMLFEEKKDKDSKSVDAEEDTKA